jgi:heme-degrading monooxygenase HmoA
MTTLINCFVVAPEQDEEFLQLWRRADEVLRSNGGYSRTRLHRALQPDARFRYVNVAELGSVDAWRSIVSGEEFQALSARMAAFQPTPGLYEVEIDRTGETRSSTISSHG